MRTRNPFLPHCFKLAGQNLWVCNILAIPQGYMNPLGYGINAYEAYRDFKRQLT